MAVPAAPQDQSGGFMVIKYANGTQVHRHRVHVLPFSLQSFVVNALTGDVDDGNHNYAYSTTRPLGSELGINDTFAAYVGIMKGLYSNAWTFTLDALYQIVATNAEEVIVLPTPTPLVGTSTTPSAGGQEPAFQTTFNFRTLGGGKARLVYMGATGQALYAPATITPNSGGGPTQMALVGYVSGANTAIVGHDGQKLRPSAHVTGTLNRRLHRSMHFA